MLSIMAALLLSGCSAFVVGPTCNLDENEYCMSITPVGDVDMCAYGIAGASLLADRFMAALVPHQADRASQDAAQKAANRAVYYSDVFVFENESDLWAACNWSPPAPNVKLHGCTVPGPEYIMLMDRGEICDSAMIHELNHKMLHALYDTWDYDHKDASWAVVHEIEGCK